MNKNSKILVLGSNGMVGSAIVRELKRCQYENVLTPSRKHLDLFDQKSVLEYFQEEKPEYVFMAAARVGGIHANNTYRADFIFENLLIETNTFNAAFKTDVQKFLFLGSTCIYPRECPQPIKEEYLLTSPLEQTNEPYAIAKIAGLKMAENFNRQYGRNFFSVMPTNLYGPNDNYHKENSHVIPGLINRMKETIDAQKDSFEVWGTGKPRREFLFVDDLANACVFLMNYEGKLPHFINVGTGTDISIGELATLIAKLMGFKGQITFNSQFPDGTPIKLSDISLLRSFGWEPKTTLEYGLKQSIDDFLNNDCRK